LLKKTYKKRKMLPTVLLLLSLLSTLIIVLFIYLEYQAREKDYKRMMEKQATMFINSISNTIQNALSSAEMLEQQINKRIISSLNLLEILHDIKNMKTTTLERIRKEIDLDAIYFYDRFGSEIRRVKKSEQINYNIPQALVSNMLTSTLVDSIIRVYDNALPSKEFLTAFFTHTRWWFVSSSHRSTRYLHTEKYSRYWVYDETNPS